MALGLITAVIGVLLFAVAICLIQPKPDDDEQEEFMRKWNNEHKR